MAVDVRVSTSTKSTEKALSNIAALVKDAEPLLNEIGTIVVKGSKGRFHRGVTATGRPWKRSKLAQKERRRTGIRTGALLESIESEATRNTLVIGSDLPYAQAFHAGRYVSPGRARRERSSRQLELSTRIDLSGNVKVRFKSRARGNAYKGKIQRGYRIPRRGFIGLSAKDRKEIRQLLKAKAQAGWK